MLFFVPTPPPLYHIYLLIFPVEYSFKLGSIIPTHTYHCLCALIALPTCHFVTFPWCLLLVTPAHPGAFCCALPAPTVRADSWLRLLVVGPAPFPTLTYLCDAPCHVAFYYTLFMQHVPYHLPIPPFIPPLPRSVMLCWEDVTPHTVCPTDIPHHHALCDACPHCIHSAAGRMVLCWTTDATAPTHRLFCGGMGRRLHGYVPHRICFPSYLHLHARITTFTLRYLIYAVGAVVALCCCPYRFVITLRRRPRTHTRMTPLPSFHFDADYPRHISTRVFYKPLAPPYSGCVLLV